MTLPNTCPGNGARPHRCCGSRLSPPSVIAYHAPRRPNHPHTARKASAQSSWPGVRTSLLWPATQRPARRPLRQPLCRRRYHHLRLPDSGDKTCVKTRWPADNGPWSGVSGRAAGDVLLLSGPAGDPPSPAPRCPPAACQRPSATRVLVPLQSHDVWRSSWPPRNGPQGANRPVFSERIPADIGLVTDVI